MEKIDSTQSKELAGLFAQQVETNRADLAVRYASILRESLFSSRAELRPNALKQIAVDEVEMLLSFLRQSGSSAAGRGEQLRQAGFNVSAVLRLSQVTRQFLLEHSVNGQFAPMLEIVAAYEMAVVEGFVQSIDNINKIERAQLEHVLTALQQRGGS